MAIQIPEEFSNPNSWGSILNDNWQEIKDRLTGVTQTGITKDEGVFQELRTSVAEIDDTDSPYTTSGESQIEADTSGGAVAVEIASADIPASGEAGRSVTIVNTDTGDLTIQTEGGEQIQPTGAGSITISTAYAYVELQLIAGVVYIDRAKDLETLGVEEIYTDVKGQTDTSVVIRRLLNTADRWNDTYYRNNSVTTTSEQISGPLTGLCYIKVFGQDGADRFLDLVFLDSLQGTVSVVHSHDSGTPDGRSYAVGSGLELSMAAGDYRVETRKETIR